MPPSVDQILCPWIGCLLERIPETSAKVAGYESIGKVVRAQGGIFFFLVGVMSVL